MMSYYITVEFYKILFFLMVFLCPIYLVIFILTKGKPEKYKNFDNFSKIVVLSFTVLSIIVILQLIGVFYSQFEDKIHSSGEYLLDLVKSFFGPMFKW